MSLIIVFIIIFIFLYVTFYKRETYQYGNIQNLGNKKYQNDYFSILQKGQRLIVTIADGMIDRKTGKYPSVLVNKIFQKNLSQKRDDYFSIFKKSILQVQISMNQSMINRVIQVSFLNITIDARRLWWCSVGNCRLFVYRDHMLSCINQGKQMGKFQMKKNDIFMLCTDGASNQLHELEMIDVLKKRNTPHEKCFELSKKIMDKQSADQDHFTIIVIENAV